MEEDLQNAYDNITFYKGRLDGMSRTHDEHKVECRAAIAALTTQLQEALFSAEHNTARMQEDHAATKADLEASIASLQAELRDAGQEAKEESGAAEETLEKIVEKDEAIAEATSGQSPRFPCFACTNVYRTRRSPLDRTADIAIFQIPVSFFG